MYINSLKGVPTPRATVFAADLERLNHVSGEIVDAAYHVYRGIGPGLYEEVYKKLLVHGLRKRGFSVELEFPVAFTFDGERFEEGYRVDLFVERLVVVELKSLERLARPHIRQTLTYLHLLEAPLALLINFGAPSFGEAVQRLANYSTPSQG